MDSRPDIPDELLVVLDQARSLGFLGPGPLDQQVAHAQGFVPAYEAAAHPGDSVDIHRGPGRWLDLGSGGGLPGLVLALLWPDSQAVLLDSAERRTEFLEGAVRALAWADRVHVVRARAEEGGRHPELRGGFDAVVARSFGPPPVTAECAAPFLRMGGVLIVSEPPREGSSSLERDTTPSPRWPREGLAAVGQEPGPAVRDHFGYQVVRQAHPCPDRFPRRMGVAAKRPIYQVSGPG